GDPPACACLPSCAGRRCGLSDGCGAECMGPCDPGFVCAERSIGNFDCVPSDCAMSCGLCEACVLGRCEPLACGAGQSPCLTSCECCGPTELCTAAGCAEFG
ncbi:MAG: hypothetical protein K8H88_05495, partial [Sandaracinaceae bacterium]|nr:hypothetical protein [Sandaracinaceae bacterium]